MPGALHEIWLMRHGETEWSLSTGSISVLGWEHDTRVIRLWNRAT